MSDFWIFECHVTDCSTGHDLFSWIHDGFQNHYTDANGHVVIKVSVDYARWTFAAHQNNYRTKGFEVAQADATQATDAKTILVKNVCLDPEQPKQEGTTKTSLDCFIVSATTGSAESAENMRLNMLRERVVRATELGNQLLDAIYREYYSFSPPIAADLAQDPQLRDQVLRVGVRPLLAWYGLVEALALDPGEPLAAQRAAHAVFDACMADPATPPAATAALWEMIRRGEPLPDGAPAPFGYVAARAQNAVARPFAAWAIFSALARAWRCAATGADVIEDARAWFAEAPLEQLEPVGGASLEAALTMLADGPMASAAVRRRVGTRLARAWPHLVEDLSRHGFIVDDEASA